LAAFRSPLLLSILTFNHSMERASWVLVEGLSPSKPRTYRAVNNHSGVRRPTIHYCAYGQQLIESRGQIQKYLTPYEEKVMVKFILHKFSLGNPVQIAHLILVPSVPLRPSPDRPFKSPARPGLRL